MIFKYISIICPIYNEEKYIAQCIGSIMRKDYPKESMEALFVDGGSIDNTRGIIAEYQKKYRFIKLLDIRIRLYRMQ
jgi:glycosyltransferase involved in cell wall biosynthesis